MKARSSILLCLLFLLCLVPVALLAKEKSGKSGDKEPPKAVVATTHHELKINGTVIKYTATAGTLLMNNDKGEPIALMGYTAYVADGGNQANRPLLFAYNGGPGSASLWLHMGVLGPQRAVTVDAGFGQNGPFQRVANEYSIIDEADLVLIDPVGTGFAKAVGKGKNADFWGVDQDIKSVSEFIVKYVSENGRWASPKYILGESYGGMRSGGVVYYLLSQHMMALNGVILVSPFMEMATGFAGLGIDLPHVMYLPTYATTAWYHNALANKPADFAAFVAEVENFALQEYAPALLMGSGIDPSQRQQVLTKLARYTGLSEDYWDRANLRIDEGRFTQELQRQRGITTGRIDSRFLGDSINLVGEKATYDPMTSAIGPAYLAAFMDYYRKDLEVIEAGDYAVFANTYDSWDWKHVQPDLNTSLPFPNTSVDLALAMKQNPAMKILVQQGYFDLATPFLATTYYLDHLDITPALRKNITVEMYEAGHMMYVHQPSLVKFKQDLAAFIKNSH